MVRRGQKVVLHYGNQAANAHRFWVSKVFSNGRFQIDSLRGSWYVEDGNIARQWNHRGFGSYIVAELVEEAV